MITHGSAISASAPRRGGWSRRLQRRGLVELPRRLVRHPTVPIGFCHDPIEPPSRTRPTEHAPGRGAAGASTAAAGGHHAFSCRGEWAGSVNPRTLPPSLSPAPAAAVRTSTALETDQRRVFTLDTRWWWTHGLPPQLVNRGGRSRGASGVARTPGPTWVGHPAGAALESAPGRAVAARRFRRIGRPALRRTRAGRRSSTRCGSQSLRGEARGCAAAPRSSPGRRREQRSPPFPPGQPALVFLQLLLFR